METLYASNQRLEFNDRIIKTTYSSLVALRNNGGLIPGIKYQITDYITKTTQTSTLSGNHQFDIIVEALTNSILSENARATLHEDDDYFSTANLAAWELKYTLDNDKTKFGWADSINGKGVIFWMKDEWGNECHYDFKNIMFKRTSAGSPSGIVPDVFYYTFSVATGTNDATVTDNSLNGTRCYGNKMGVYIVSNKQKLNSNVFRNTSATADCYSNTFGGNCYNNTFGNNCYSNTFGNTCSSNTFGNNCYSNTFGNNCQYIKFGTSSTVKNYCRYIIVENANRYIYLNCSATTSTSSYFQNVKIAQGVNNISSYKTITHTTAEDTFQTIYKPANSQIISV